MNNEWHQISQDFYHHTSRSKLNRRILLRVLAELPNENSLQYSAMSEEELVNEVENTIGALDSHRVYLAAEREILKENQEKRTEVFRKLSSPGWWEEKDVPASFMAPFGEKKAWENRQKAYKGYLVLERWHEVETYKSILELRSIHKSEQASTMIRSNSLSAYIASFMISSTPSQIRWLADLIEGKKQINNRGGLESASGYVLEAFCDCSIQARGLPTKTEIRDATPFQSDSDRRNFSNFMRDLGLSGLED